ncbi:MAG TPA: NADH-quinone oxidoreductase subunit NuoN [Gammaproteobacteria bacterium]
MTAQTYNFLPALPEMFMLGMICLILVIDLFLSERSRVVTYLLSQATLVGTFALTLSLYGTQPEQTFNGMFINDLMGLLLKLATLIATFMVLAYSRSYLREHQMFSGEFFVLGLAAVLGMMVMISAHHFVPLYLGLELLSLSLYAMVAMQRDSVAASEAAMKYFVLGAMASAMLLYGMSMIYGATASLNLGDINIAVQSGRPDDLVLVFGLVFVMVGVAFKLGAVPFHMWVPDVYHGAPTAVTLFVSSAPKIAAFAMLMRLLVDGLSGIYAQWHDILVVLAFLSMAIGNIVAIAQSNIKRMLAYSGISHMGFLMLGVIAGNSGGYASAMYYALVYVLMGLGGFGMVILLSRAGFEAERLDDFKGLNERSPWYAALMLFFMFSMAGVPPFLGFWAKLGVIQSLVATGHMPLAVAAVLFSVIGAFYYLRIVKLIYFDKPQTGEPIRASGELRLVLGVNGMAVLLLGIFPETVIALCKAAMGAV